MPTSIVHLPAESLGGLKNRRRHPAGFIVDRDIHLLVLRPPIRNRHEFRLPQPGQRYRRARRVAWLYPTSFPSGFSS